MKNYVLWFTDYNKAYQSSESIFFSVKDIKVAEILEEKYNELQTELKVLWENPDQDGAVTFGNYYAFDDKQFPPRSWHKMVFKVWGIRNRNVCKIFPKTASLLDKYPEITSCYLTKTSPHSVIRPHCGETNAHIRIHLGLNVPEVDVSICGMAVKGQLTGWKNGKTFAFLDAHNHHVWNNSDYDRYILMVDILRPEFMRRKYFIYARVIVSQLFYYVASLLKLRNPDIISATALDLLAYIFYLPILIITKTNNLVGVFNL